MSPSLKGSPALSQSPALRTKTRTSVQALALAAAFSALAQSACTTDFPIRDNRAVDGDTVKPQDGGVEDDATTVADGSREEEDVLVGDAQRREDARTTDAQPADAQPVDAHTTPDGDPLCVTVEEICDGRDNNCDGQIDESFPQENCSVGVGACEQTGVQLCEDGSIVCSAQAGLPETEVCNGIDDDCDGITDEGNRACATELTIACPGPDQTNRMCAFDEETNSVTHCISEDDGCSSLDDDQDLRVLNLGIGERALVITTRGIERTTAPLRLLTAELPLEVACVAAEARHLEPGDDVTELIEGVEPIESTRVYDSITEYAVDTAAVSGGQGICVITKRP